MRMSVGIGPFRIYSGGSRRRSRYWNAAPCTIRHTRPETSIRCAHCQQGRAAQAAASARRLQLKASREQTWLQYRQEHEGRLAPSQKKYIRAQLIGWTIVLAIIGGMVSCSVAVNDHNNRVQDEQTYQSSCQAANNAGWIDHNNNVRDCTDAP
jgi:hypothetical protein